MSNEPVRAEMVVSTTCISAGCGGNRGTVIIPAKPIPSGPGRTDRKLRQVFGRTHLLSPGPTSIFSAEMTTMIRPEWDGRSLNWLITVATAGPQWGVSLGYDGFGNWVTQTVTKGSKPAVPSASIHESDQL